MKQIQALAFSFTDQAVRVVTIDGKPWFVAADVCRVLGYNVKADGTVNTNNALRPLRDDEVSSRLIIETGGRPNKVISESGLYKLIMRSDKPEARDFQRWVTRDVLPAIRKDGGYFIGEEKVATGEMTEDELVAKAMAVLQRKVAQEKQSRQQLVRDRPCSSEEAWT